MRPRSPEAEWIIKDYEDATIDELHAVYTDFRSAFTMRATDKRFLPISHNEVVHDGPTQVSAEYSFEPEGILGDLLPQYVIAKIFAVSLIPTFVCTIILSRGNDGRIRPSCISEVP